MILAETGFSEGQSFRSKLAERVAVKIEADVIRRGWPVGERLGSEASLIARFGVSRATMREAVRIVEAHGAAQMLRGPKGGLVVIAPQMSSVQAAAARFLDWANVRPHELFEVRSMLELAVIRQLIERLDQALIDRLRQALDEEREQFATHGIRAETPDIHVRLARLTGNPAAWLFVDVLTRLTQQRANPYVPDDDVTARELHLTHTGIIDAIIDGDLGVAQHRMDRHLRAVASFFR